MARNGVLLKTINGFVFDMGSCVHGIVSTFVPIVGFLSREHIVGLKAEAAIMYKKVCSIALGKMNVEWWWL